METYILLIDTTFKKYVQKLLCLKQNPRTKHKYVPFNFKYNSHLKHSDFRIYLYPNWIYITTESLAITDKPLQKELFFL